MTGRGGLDSPKEELGLWLARERQGLGENFWGQSQIERVAAKSWLELWASGLQFSLYPLPAPPLYCAKVFSIPWKVL